MADKLGRKHDDHGHIIGNNESDGQECQHGAGGSSKNVYEDKKGSITRDKKGYKVNKNGKESYYNTEDDAFEAFDDDYEEEFNDEPSSGKSLTKGYFDNFKQEDINKYIKAYQSKYPNISPDTIKEIVNKRWSFFRPYKDIEGNIEQDLNNINKDVKEDQMEFVRNLGFTPFEEDEQFDEDMSQDEYLSSKKEETDKFKKQLDNAGYKLKDKEYGLEKVSEPNDKLGAEGFGLDLNDSDVRDAVNERIRNKFPNGFENIDDPELVLDDNDWKEIKEQVDEDKAQSERFAKKGEIVKKYQEMGYDPATAQMKAEKDVLSEEISTAIDDNSWTVTGNTTVGQYAEEIAQKVGTFKENVIDFLKQNSGKDISENDKMSDVMGFDEGDFDSDDEYENSYANKLENSRNKIKEFNMPENEGWKQSNFGEKSFVKNEGTDEEINIQYNGAGFDGAEDWVVSYNENGEWKDKHLGSLDEAKDFVNNLDSDKIIEYDDERPDWDPAKDAHYSAYDNRVKKGNYSDEDINAVIQLAEEYGKNATRGFITPEEMKMVADKMGLTNLSDRDLRLAWNKYNDILGRESFKGGSMKRWKKFGDAQSAFAEVINQEARKRKESGNYFPYNDEDIQVGRNRIADLARPHESYDADSPEGYMSSDELREVENLANQYHLTDDDLAKISRMFDKKFGYGGRGWKNPTHTKLKEFGYSDEEIAKMSKEDMELAADFFARFNNPKPRR